MIRTRTAYVAFATAAEPPLTVAGKLMIPEGGARPGGAVLICHGSDGVDGRGDFYAPALHEAGLSTLEIDMWAARGAVRGAAARPRSPIDTLPDAFAARAFLAVQPEIDPARIGIMGFSWGGVVTLLSAARRFAVPLGGGGAFAAHAANYPVCWAFLGDKAFQLTDLTGAPLLIQTGAADAYDEPGAGARLVDALRAAGARDVTGVTHEGAGHGYDRDLPAQTINDPFAHQGRGGPVLMAFDDEAARASRANIVAFFERTLAPR
jgi:dienelactone hydrolase